MLRVLPCLALAAVLLPAGRLPAAEPADRNVADAYPLAGKIEQFFAGRWSAAEVRPAAPADDAEFIRRVTLDLTGKIPAVSEVRAFLDDPSPGKRQRLVEHLLRSGGYVAHFANFWRTVLLPETNAQFEDPTLRLGLEAWLRKRLGENAGYDRMVREILTANAVNTGRRGLQVVGAQMGGEPSPLAFLQANEFKPENLAGATSRLFLGAKLECAQCHNHPFAKWTREQFWQYAAFFNGVQGGRQAREIRIPNLDKVVKARFLDDSEPQWKDGVNPRTTLADWMTGAGNRYFARAVVNRMWAYLFGDGLLEPVDDLREDNGNGALLDELAQEFTAHGYDLKFLLRALVNSRVYQLSSTLSHPSQEEPTLFQRMPVRGLSPEQLFDSLVEATGFQEGGPANLRSGISAARIEFLARFTNQLDKRTEHQTSILQALALMNGKFVGDATSVTHSETLAAVAEAPFLDTAGRVEALYLATLSRKPRPEESARLVQYVNRGGPTGDGRQALADVFWALLNSSEFMFNH